MHAVSVLLPVPPLTLAGNFHGNTMLSKFEGEVVLEVRVTHVLAEEYVQKY